MIELKEDYVTVKTSGTYAKAQIYCMVNGKWIRLKEPVFEVIQNIMHLYNLDGDVNIDVSIYET